jgi:hypothetical protein
MTELSWLTAVRCAEVNIITNTRKPLNVSSCCLWILKKRVRNKLWEELMTRRLLYFCCFISYGEASGNYESISEV